MDNITVPASITVPAAVKTYLALAPQVANAPAKWGDNTLAILPKYRPRATSMYTSGQQNGKTAVRLVVPRTYTNASTTQVLSDGNITVDLIVQGPLVCTETELLSAVGQAVGILMSTPVKTALTDRRPNV